MISTKDYSGNVLFFFENGKVAKLDLSVYKTKNNRKKLINAYSDKSNVVAIKHIISDKDLLLTASSGRMLIINTDMLQVKTTKTTQGVAVMSLRKSQRLLNVDDYENGQINDENRYRPKNLPATGSLPRHKDNQVEQLTL